MTVPVGVVKVTTSPGWMAAAGTRFSKTRAPTGIVGLIDGPRMITGR
jgi:hypothetical protein